MTTWQRWKQYPIQVLIAGDQLLNALIPPFTTLSYADETMSARIYRAAKRGRIVGSAVMPPVDWVFSLWQRNADGTRRTNHCEHAYRKEVERRNLPPEYREKTSR
jgi:hypothetical protein